MTSPYPFAGASLCDCGGCYDCEIEQSYDPDGNVTLPPVDDAPISPAMLAWLERRDAWTADLDLFEALIAETEDEFAASLRPLPIVPLRASVARLIDRTVPA